MQDLIADREIRTNGESQLFAYTVLCSYANFRTAYRRLFGITYTLYPGEWAFRVSELKECLRVRTLKQAMAPRRHYHFSNDGFDENGLPVLLAYTCDIPRIHRFFTGLQMYDEEGVMFCFDFQEKILKEICGDCVYIRYISSEEYKNSSLFIDEE